MAIIKNANNNKHWQGCAQNGSLIHCWLECKLVQLLYKKLWRLQILKTEFPYEPTISPLEIYLKECKSGYKKDTCTSMVIAALFTIAKLWKQSTTTISCSTIDKWIKKIQCLYTMAFYSGIKKYNILLFAGNWMELENITLHEFYQVQRAKGRLFFLSYVEYRFIQTQAKL
jgi:hypothetical protein